MELNNDENRKHYRPGFEDVIAAKAVLVRKPEALNWKGTETEIREVII